MPDLPVTVGTAGHVDHGKTALVEALTGKRTDRLPEEGRRGLSIELGFAPLNLPGGRRLSLVDVPGHERFVRTMVAGASGIDMYLLCVAADDGVMPQTREHAAVLRQLGVETGVVAVTKTDLADPGRAVAEAATLAPGAPVVLTSVRSGEGLEELRTALVEAAGSVTSRALTDGPTRLHVDRSFTLQGIGTVVTGTLWSGSLGAGDRVRLEPGGPGGRVRSVQVHDEPVPRALAGQRVAAALAGVDRREATRGQVLVTAESRLAASYRLDAALRLEPGVALEPHARVQVHHGTRESAARIVPLDDAEPPEHVQLRLETALVAAEGDRLILRALAPPATLGGGIVVDPSPARHRRLGVEAEQAAETRSPPAVDEPHEAAPISIELLERVREALAADGWHPRSDSRLREDLELEPSELELALAELVRTGVVVRTGRAQHYEAGALQRALEELRRLGAEQGAVTIGSLRDALQTSRKYAQGLLEYSDRMRITRREADRHMLRRPR